MCVYIYIYMCVYVKRETQLWRLQFNYLPYHQIIILINT